MYVHVHTYCIGHLKEHGHLDIIEREGEKNRRIGHGKLHKKEAIIHVHVHAIIVRVHVQLLREREIHLIGNGKLHKKRLETIHVHVHAVNVHVHVCTYCTC